MTDRWKVRRARLPSTGRFTTEPIWDVYEPGGTWSGSFDRWSEAMEWATSIASRVEHWLAHHHPQAAK